MTPGFAGEHLAAAGIMASACIRRPYGGRVEGPLCANRTKSITQINLARLTVGKSLSGTDSAQLQPPLIRVGGAVAFDADKHSQQQLSASRLSTPRR